MKTRILSGLVMLPLLAVVFFGSWLLAAACIIVGVMGIREFYGGFQKLDIHPSFTVGYIGVLLLYGIYFLGVIADTGAAAYLPVPDENWMMAWFFLVLLFSFLYLFKIDQRRLEDGMVTAIGVFYVVFFSYHVVLIARMEQGGVFASSGAEVYFSVYPRFLWLVILTAFGTDIMAYFSGYAFGKHKLCPKISPKKTVEGAVGGTLGSVALCGIFGWLVLPEYIVHCLVIGLLGSVCAQFGDLTASIFKRKMGIKDYGNLIPGHGGIMDRFDSVLFTAPVIYYYMSLVIFR